jgi:hypothetical protein
MTCMRDFSRRSEARVSYTVANEVLSPWSLHSVAGDKKYMYMNTNVH